MEDKRIPCPHEVLGRLGMAFEHQNGDLAATLYRCEACGGVVLVASQFLPGIRRLLEEAKAKDDARGIR